VSAVSRKEEFAENKFNTGNKVFPLNVFYSQNSSGAPAKQGACCRNSLAREKI